MKIFKTSKWWHYQNMNWSIYLISWIPCMIYKANENFDISQLFVHEWRFNEFVDCVSCSTSCTVYILHLNTSFITYKYEWSVYGDFYLPLLFSSHIRYVIGKLYFDTTTTILQNHIKYVSFICVMVVRFSIFYYFSCVFTYGSRINSTVVKYIYSCIPVIETLFKPKTKFVSSTSS